MPARCRALLVIVYFFFCGGALQAAPQQTSQPLAAQEAKSNDKDFVTNRVFQLGAGYQSKQYRFLSHLEYDGPSVGVNLHYFNDLWENGLLLRNYSAEIGQLTHEVSPSSLLSVGLNAQVGYLHKFYQLPWSVDLFAGAVLDVDADVNYLPINTNNPVAFLFSNNLNPAVLFRQSQDFGFLQLHWQNQTYTNIIGYTLFAPEYAFATPYFYFEQEQREFSSAVNLLHPRNYFRLVNRFHLDVKSEYIANYSLRIAYRFTGLHAVLNQNSYRHATHFFSVGFIYRLFRY